MSHGINCKTHSSYCAQLADSILSKSYMGHIRALLRTIKSNVSNIKVSP